MVTYKDSAYVVLASHYILNVIAMTHAQKLPCFYAYEYVHIFATYIFWISPPGHHPLLDPFAGEAKKALGRVAFCGQQFGA